MLRKATLEDFDFIISLIIAEVKNGHFHKSLSWFFPRVIFKSLVIQVLTKGHRRGMPGRFFIMEKKGVKIGFSSLVFYPDKRCELWLASIKSEYRNQGYGRLLIGHTMIFLQKNNPLPSVELFARLLPASTVMMKTLQPLGFKMQEQTKKGYVLSREIS